MKKSIETYIVDSFTNESFKGNPAGVCILQESLSPSQMQDIAKELGLSETTFIQKNTSKGDFSIRYFSPKMEIPLCGHATLAASKVVFAKEPDLENIHFVNIQNLDLLISQRDGKIEMKFPIYSTERLDPGEKLVKALGLNGYLNSEYNKETNIIVLEISSPDVLADLEPDFEKLKKSHNSINGVLVTAASEKADFDFESRYFWPWSGTNEDPVTGGTHTFLASYWGKRLGKTKMNSFQCSARTGFMEVELINSKELFIRGEAQIVLEGKLFL